MNFDMNIQLEKKVQLIIVNYKTHSTKGLNQSIMKISFITHDFSNTYPVVKLNIHVFPKTTGVVIAVCFGISKGLQGKESWQSDWFCFSREIYTVK